MSSVASTQSTTMADALNSVTNSTTDSGTPIVSGPKALGQADFLNLMIAQLKNQDPMNPMDNEAFIAQLAQFSQLEASNQLVTLMQQNNTDLQGAKQVGLVSLLGHQVKLSGAMVQLGNGPASVQYTLAGDAASVQVNILNAANQVIRTIAAGGQSAGNQEVSWDGLDQNGVQVAQGTYGFSVSANDSMGHAVTATPVTIATVTGVKNDASNPMLLIGNQQVDPQNVLEVY
jgi:flagellar basal-body rod modification protein FlgD